MIFFSAGDVLISKENRSAEDNRSMILLAGKVCFSAITIMQLLAVVYWRDWAYTISSTLKGSLKAREHLKTRVGVTISSELFDVLGIKRYKTVYNVKIHA